MSKKKPERFFVIYVVVRCWQGLSRKEIDVDGGTTYTEDGTWHEKVLFASISPARAKIHLTASQAKLNYREPFYIKMLRYTAETMPESINMVLQNDLEFGE